MTAQSGKKAVVCGWKVDGPADRGLPSVKLPPHTILWQRRHLAFRNPRKEPE